MERTLRILCVDDDLRIGQILTRALSRWGHTVVAVTTGVAALEILDGQAFDLLISDWKMPGMCGCDLVRQAQARVPSLPAIFISGNAASLDVPEDIRILEILQKPVGLQILRDSLAAV